MKVYLLTTGDGDDGNEWNVHGIYSTRDKAEEALVVYDPVKRNDGSVYSRGATVEEWTVDSFNPTPTQL